MFLEHRFLRYELLGPADAPPFSLIGRTAVGVAAGKDNGRRSSAAESQGGVRTSGASDQNANSPKRRADSGSPPDHLQNFVSPLGGDFAKCAGQKTLGAIKRRLSMATVNEGLKLWPNQAGKESKVISMAEPCFFAEPLPQFAALGERIRAVKHLDKTSTYSRLRPMARNLIPGADAATVSLSRSRKFRQLQCAHGLAGRGHSAAGGSRWRRRRSVR